MSVWKYVSNIGASSDKEILDRDIDQSEDRKLGRKPIRGRLSVSGCTRLIWSPHPHTPDIIKTRRRREMKQRGNPFLGKIEIYLIGQIYPSGKDMSPHNSFLRHISSQGRNLKTFLRDGQLLDKRWKVCIHPLWAMEPIFKRSQDTEHGVWARLMLSRLMHCTVLWCVLCIVMGWRQYINNTSIWRWQESRQTSI